MITQKKLCLGDFVITRENLAASADPLRRRLFFGRVDQIGVTSVKVDWGIKKEELRPDQLIRIEFYEVAL